MSARCNHDAIRTGFETAWLDASLHRANNLNGVR
ncbi:hypothetical protein SPHINGO391_410059 [Sphingomonas aurantiaca]|uniref:Uncharacterized protein n=1 Tax=Sphingomonas aurantiaca TaxID=185949 RepID=A0A5E7YYL4_9SPHN|nr:hypothetical protein SPHINGO391_410059 [Sphingomonas aurantiaca]